MKLISQLIENIKKYSNCQIYYTCEGNSNRNYVYNFYFDGALFVSELLYDYDKPFWNGKRFDKSAVVKHFDICSSSSADLNLLEIMAHIVRLSITDENYCAGITYKENVRTFDTTIEVCELYSMVDNMLNLSNRQLVLACESGGYNFEKILINNVPKALKTDCDLRVDTTLVDEKLEQVKKRYRSICLLHDEVFSSKTADEYKSKKGQWYKYCSDESTSNVPYIKR